MAVPYLPTRRTSRSRAASVRFTRLSVAKSSIRRLNLVVKNHSFSDGNKRIAAMLFLWFMDRNKVLYAADGHKRIADNTLVALTLMIAESRPEEKDIIVKLVVNLINQNNQ